MTILEENNAAWLEAMEGLAPDLEGLDVAVVVTSTAEADHGPLPRFRIRWAEDVHGHDVIRKQELAMKKLHGLLKRGKMELSHTDDDGFQVYRPWHVVDTGKPKRRARRAA